MPALVVVESAESGNRSSRLLFETGPADGDATAKGSSAVGVADWFKDTIFGKGEQGHAGSIGDLAAIQSMADAVVDGFSGMATDKSDGGNFSTAEVSFGLKVSAEGNTFVTKVGTEANLTVTFTWDFA